MTFLNTDKMKLSVLVVSFLLLASAFTFIPAVGAFSPTTVATAGPAPASVTGATATIDSPILAGLHVPVIRTITVSNPIGNPAITSLTVSVPQAAVVAGQTGQVACPTSAATALTNGANYTEPCGGYYTTSGVPGSPTVQTYGSGPWAIVFSAASGSVLVPGGATINLQVGFTTESSTTTSGVADSYSISVSATDSTNGVTNLTPITIYETASTTVTVTGPTGSLIAGTPFTVKASGTDSGLQLQVSASGQKSNGKSGTSATTTLSPSSFISGPNTGSQSISVNDTTAEQLTITVSGGKLATGSSYGGVITGNTGALTIYPGAITSLAVEITNNGVTYTPNGANKILNVTNTWGKTPLIGNGADTNNITVSTADKFGNPVQSTGTTQVTVTADTFSGQAAGFNVSSAAYGTSYPYSPTNGVLSSLQLTIPANSASVTVTDNYFFGVDYGSQSQIVATSTSGLATGKSAMIDTYTLNTNALTLKASTTSPTAGSTVTVDALISGTQQANVPVNFANTTDTTGMFTNGLTSINVTTTVASNGTEYAAATFTPSTKAGATVGITAKDNLPGTNGVFTYNTATVTPVTLTTQGGKITQLVVLTAFDSAFAHKSSSVTSKGALYVAIRTGDAYGNPSDVSANTQTQLSSSGGLSATLLEIVSGQSDTVNSSLSGFQWSIFTPTTGSSFTITATATVGGVPLTGSTTVTVVSATPLLSATGPTSLTSGIPSAITGTTNASTGIQSNQITSITYSVNGGVKQNVAFTSAANVAFSFSVLLSGTSNINITVTDSAGNSAWTIVTVPPLAPGQTFTSAKNPVQYQFPNGGPQAVNATFTNNGASSVQIIVIANIFTSGGVPITPSPTATATVAAGATVSTFPLLNGLPHGTYTVTVNVYSTSYVSLSPTYTITVTV